MNICCIAALVGIAACSKPSTPQQQRQPAVASGAPIPAKVTIVDGVTQMTHDAADIERAPRFTVETEPVAELGRDTDPKYDVTYADGLAILSNGNYATVAGLGARILIFDSTGKGARMVGRSGQGPGDFGNPTAVIAMPGDTLYVPDMENARANYITPQNGKVISAPLDRKVAFQLTPTGILPGHQMVGFFRFEPHWTADTIGSPKLPILVASLDGTDLHTIDSVPAQMSAYIPITQRTHESHATVPVRFRSRLSVVAWDSVIAISRDDLGYVVQVRSAQGRLLQQLSLRRARRPVTATMRDAQVAEEKKHIVTAASGEGELAMSPANQEKMILDTPTRDSLPQIERIFTTPAGTLWVFDPIAPTDSAVTATAFGKDGAIIGRLALPGHDHPFAVGNDRVAVRHEDESGLITFRVYRLIPPS